MTSIDDVMIEITPQVLLKAYACGIFPMAESAEDNALYWIEPERRGILPLDRVHVPQRLARTIRKGGFTVRIDHDFDAVIEGCAAPRSGRRSTWINGRIRGLYRDLFALGHCHTVEVYDEEQLIGGLYGVHLGRAFFGESMFSRARDASKIALVYLVARLKFGGFELLDTQFVTGHLARFGAIEVGRPEFQRLLEGALGGGAAGGAGRRCRCRGFRGVLVARRGRRRGRGLAAREPDVVDRVLDRVKAGALGEHPAGEDALHLAGELGLIHLDEGVGMGRLGGGPRVAHPRRHLQRAELHGLIDRYLQMRDAARHLVQRGEHGNRILDLLGERVRREPERQQEDEGKPAAPWPIRSLHSCPHLLDECDIAVASKPRAPCVSPQARL